MGARELGCGVCGRVLGGPSGVGCLRLVGRHVGLAAAQAGGRPAAPGRALGGCLVFPGFIFVWGALLSVVGKAEGGLCFGQVGLRML